MELQLHWIGLVVISMIPNTHCMIANDDGSLKFPFPATSMRLNEADLTQQEKSKEMETFSVVPSTNDGISMIPSSPL